MNEERMRKHANKLTTGEKAIAEIRPGERIFISSGSAVPSGLLPFLVDKNAPIGDNQIIHLLTLGEAPYADPKFEGTFRHNALFIGPNVRRAVTEGRADYTPIFLSEIPALIKKRQIPIDVALISVTPPDENGNCSIGTHVDIAPAAIDAARLVIAHRADGETARLTVSDWKSDTEPGGPIGQAMMFNFIELQPYLAAE